MAIQPVTSAANPLIRDVRRAVARGGLTSAGLCVAEGFHLLEEAERSRCEVVTVLATSAAAPRAAALTKARIVAVADALFESLSTTETTQGVIALVRPPEWEFADLFGPNSLLLILDGVQDPGNAGTLVRSAEAFGASGVIFLKGTVSPWNPKTLRGSAGSLFRVPLGAGVEFPAIRAALREHDVKLCAAMPSSPSRIPADRANLDRPVAIVIGSEGRGVSPLVLAAAEEIAIPTTGVESLSAATAGAILL